MIPFLQFLKNDPEPALSATHPAKFAPGDTPKSWRNPPKDQTIHATHTEAHGIEIESPQEYIENEVKPHDHGV